MRELEQSIVAPLHGDRVNIDAQILLVAMASGESVPSAQAAPATAKSAEKSPQAAPPLEPSDRPPERRFWFGAGYVEQFDASLDFGGRDGVGRVRGGAGATFDLRTVSIGLRHFVIS